MKSREEYIKEYSTPSDEVLKWITRETNIRTNHGRMLSGEVLGKFLEIISALISPSRILEIGTFTGYSAICLAKGLKEDGLLHSIELNDELSDIIENGFKMAGVEKKVIMHYGDAKKIIGEIDEVFDLVYIDANKREYCEYYELVFNKVRPGGIILADNVLWSDKVLLDPVPADKQTQQIIKFNNMIKDDRRVEKVLLPLRDGLYLLRKI